MSVPTEIARIKGLRNDIRSRLIQIGALGDPNADLEACRDAMAIVSTLTLSSIAITTPPDKTNYEPGESFDPAGMVVTATFAYGDSEISFDVSDYEYPTEPIDESVTEVTISYTFGAITKTTTQEVTTFEIDLDLDNNSWEAISWVAKHGLGSTYWNIGDRKAVTLNGMIGDYCPVSLTLYVYILDFNHPENGVPDNNILFGGFFTAKTGGKDVCFVDNAPNVANLGDKIAFELYHYRDVGTTDYIYNGGWKACQFRNDILGATENKPSITRQSNTATSIGYDATQAAISNPVADTLMKALPASFRNVLRLRKHYTNLVSANGGVWGTNIVATVDAVSLLTEYEVFGACQYSSPYEGAYQSQMAYYANGGSPVKYKHNDQSTPATWWTASSAFSPSRSDEPEYCAVQGNGTAKTYNAMDYRLGLAPVFKV